MMQTGLQRIPSMHLHLPRAPRAALTLGLALLAGCSGGGGSASQGGFQLVSISVPEGGVWPINKRIDLVFNAEVDLSSVVAGSTLQLKSIDGSGASAFYELAYKTDPDTSVVDKTTLVIQPFCPLLGDLSDAGLEPGSKHYQIYVPGVDDSLSTIKSVSGGKLQLSQTRSFFTPASLDPALVFDDTQVGPPTFLPEGTFVRLGDGTEIPFVFSGTQYELPVELPLNFYRDPASHVEYLVQINQAVDPSEENLNDDRVRLEVLDDLGTWQPFETLVALESNCALDAPGAVLRLTPVGILPQDAEVRAVLVSGFSDLVGEQSPADQANFISPTVTVAFASLDPADDAADEVYEDFVFPGGPPGSFQDTTATFDTPPAVWAGGELSAAFDFQGTGGPGGTFDWHTPPGLFNFSTDLQQITGGPGGVATTQVTVLNGQLDVNDLFVQAGSVVRIQPGNNPLIISATGDVIIEGTLDLRGFDAKPVFTLLTPNLPEPGALGAAGGGRGGTGSPLTSASDAKGGDGEGAFGAEGAGGKGGETGFHPTGKQERRGAGGGGGRFGPDMVPADELGEAATAGGPGHEDGGGALSGGSFPAQGGLPGTGPFLDSNPDNNFFGSKAVFSPEGALLEVVGGEIPLALAGAGGGAGGDAIEGASFPTIPFFTLPGPVYKDAKGAGGGGGGGQVQIIALGRIIFRAGGRILSGGGNGNQGESTVGAFHIAGSSGGGSGGHIILQSATQIDFTDGGLNPAAEEFIQARGGVGGIDVDETGPLLTSGGGNGGPGVVQLHVPDPNPATAVGTELESSIRVLNLADIDVVAQPPGEILIPTFGARSKARSIWIPLGSATEAPGGGDDPLLFAFDGTDEDRLSLTAGQILTVGQVVPPLPPLLGPETLASAAPGPFVDLDGFTLVLSEPSLLPLIGDAATATEPSDDIYLRNPALMRNFLLRLSSLSASQDFDVASATYSDANLVLRLTVSTAAGSLETFIAAQGGPANVDYELIPRFFRARTGAVQDLIPDTGFVKILFQAAAAGPEGLPVEDPPLVDWTPDVGDLSLATPGEIQFFRWEVEFNLDSAGAGLTVDTEPISLEFLRVPFSF
jgi:hypothetical protein